MRKIIAFLCLCACFATSAIAAEPTCEGRGGTIIKAYAATDPGCSDETCNGHEFCKSDKTMNWWSAFTWCESQNRKLADFATMCPGVSQTPAGTEGNCPNLQGKGGGPVWSNLAYDSDRAILVNLSSGIVYDNTRNSNYYALCE